MSRSQSAVGYTWCTSHTFFFTLILSSLVGNIPSPCGYNQIPSHGAEVGGGILCRVQPKLLPSHASIGIGQSPQSMASLTLTLCGTRGEEKFDLGNSTELLVEEVDRCRSLNLKDSFFFKSLSQPGD